MLVLLELRLFAMRRLNDAVCSRLVYSQYGIPWITGIEFTVNAS